MPCEAIKQGIVEIISRFNVRRKYLFSIIIILLMLITVYIKLIRHGFLGEVNKQRMTLTGYEHLQNRKLVTKPILLLYWSKAFGQPVQINNTRKVPYFYVNQDCDQKCELTVNKSRAVEADAIIVHARDPKPFPPEKFSRIPFILHTHENPVHTPILKNPFLMSHFRYLISYRLDSDFPFPLFAKPALTPPVPFKQKHKMVFAAFSNCETVRTKYLALLMKLIDVHSYGSCLKNKNGLAKRYEKSFKVKKTELSRHYMFTLVFMNTDCEYFLDDQLTHALSAGSVPVFMGSDKVDKFLPGNLNSSIIKVKDFKSPRDLAKYLNFLSSNEFEYNKYLKWKNQGFQFPLNYNSTPIGQFWESHDSVYCKICKRLAQNNDAKKPHLKPDMCKKRALRNWL